MHYNNVKFLHNLFILFLALRNTHLICVRWAYEDFWQVACDNSRVGFSFKGFFPSPGDVIVAKINWANNNGEMIVGDTTW